MAFKGGRLELLVPHLLRGQLLRPGFVRLSLRLGVARQMPAWAKLQFIHSGVSPEELDVVLGRIKSLSSWVEEWQALGREHETRGQEAQAVGDLAHAAREYLAASAAYNFAQHVVFLDVNHKRLLHESCVRVYRMAAPLFDPPARLFEVPFRRRVMRGYLRVPRGLPRSRDGRGAPVVVFFNGTNSVKEELHWWTEALLAQGLAVIAFDGPGMGHTFHRLSMVGEPRPVGEAILNEIEAHPELDIDAVGAMGLSLGGYLAIRMAAHDRRIRAVAAVSPPYALDVYWNITLAGMRRELAALYEIDEREMGSQIERLTLNGFIDTLRCPLMVAGGGHDHLTPGREAWRIFEDARCERELVYYPRAGHECFNVLADLRPRMTRWLARHIVNGRADGVTAHAWGTGDGESLDPARIAAGAVHEDFADALNGDVVRPVWNHAESPGLPVRWRWPWGSKPDEHIEVIQRSDPGDFGPDPGPPRPLHRSSDVFSY